jgi:hypothetical protein
MHSFETNTIAADKRDIAQPQTFGEFYAVKEVA